MNLPHRRASRQALGDVDTTSKALGPARRKILVAEHRDRQLGAARDARARYRDTKWFSGYAGEVTTRELPQETFRRRKMWT